MVCYNNLLFPQQWGCLSSPPPLQRTVALGSKLTSSCSVKWFLKACFFSESHKHKNKIATEFKKKRTIVVRVSYWYSWLCSGWWLSCGKKGNNGVLGLLRALQLINSLSPVCSQSMEPQGSVPAQKHKPSPLTISWIMNIIPKAKGVKTILNICATGSASSRKHRSIVRTTWTVKCIKW